jgi:hypothetical protein
MCQVPNTLRRGTLRAMGGTGGTEDWSGSEHARWRKTTMKGSFHCGFEY